MPPEKPTNFCTFPTKPIAQYIKTSYLCTQKIRDGHRSNERQALFSEYEAQSYFAPSNNNNGAKR